MPTSWNPFIRIRRCPRCQSFHVYRHRGGSKIKRFFLRLVLARRYSCMNCNSLYYGYLFSRRKSADE